MFFELFREKWFNIFYEFSLIFNEFSSKIADFLSILSYIFIDFHWFFMNLLWLFSDFLSIFIKGLLRNWSGISLIFSEFYLKNSWFYYDFSLIWRFWNERNISFNFHDFIINFSLIWPRYSNFIFVSLLIGFWSWFHLKMDLNWISRQ